MNQCWISCLSLTLRSTLALKKINGRFDCRFVRLESQASSKEFFAPFQVFLEPCDVLGVDLVAIHAGVAPMGEISLGNFPEERIGSLIMPVSNWRHISSGGGEMVVIGGLAIRRILNLEYMR